jgi:molecular chaperone GrpE
MTAERRQRDAPGDDGSAPAVGGAGGEAAARPNGGGPAPSPGEAAAPSPGEAAGPNEGEEAAVSEAELVEQDLAAAHDTVRRERDEYLDMLRRVQADFENYKKRMLRHQTDLLERAAESLVVRLLPVLDAFDLARAHLEAEGTPETKALLQAAGLLSDTLAKEGLERLDDRGAVFDPTRHEAVEHEPADKGELGAEPEEAGEPVVSEVLRPGYRYKGKVIRPAMVRVQG